MPEIKIRGEKNEPAIKLFLESDGDKVTLSCIGMDGEEWNILTITGEGKCILHSCISNNSGLQVTESQYIKIERG